MSDHAQIEVTAPFAGVVVTVEPDIGALVHADAAVVVLEAMKMEHEVLAGAAGTVASVAVKPGDSVGAGDMLLTLAPADGEIEPAEVAAASDTDGERADLAAVIERHAVGLDAARPEAVAKRRERGRRTARENLADLVDDGTYVEYGPLIFAAQERRRSREELIAATPADGLVVGVGEVDGRPCVAMSYDYTVLAGTQGMRGHQKKDRLFELAERRRLPVVLFAEGGGGRPGDVDWPMVAGLDCRAFQLFARLSARVPLVGIASGYCFAGNAALLGCCDVVIATEDSSIGMGGPAMIEGGGLGSYHPGEVGPIDVQHANGVVDLRVADDAAAVAAAKRYLSYFHGPVSDWAAPDQLALRSFAAPLSCVGWPTSEFGGMGLEGAVRLGLRRELAAIEDESERERVFEATVAAAYEHGKGINMAAYGEIDDVIDPADSRRWIVTLFDPPVEDWRECARKRRPNVDAW